MSGRSRLSPSNGSHSSWNIKDAFLRWQHASLRAVGGAVLPPYPSCRAHTRNRQERTSPAVAPFSHSPKGRVAYPAKDREGTFSYPPKRANPMQILIRIERSHPRRRSPCPLWPPHYRHAFHSGYGHTAAIAEDVFLGCRRRRGRLHTAHRREPWLGGSTGPGTAQGTELTTQLHTEGTSEAPYACWVAESSSTYSHTYSHTRRNRYDLRATAELK